MENKTVQSIWSIVNKYSGIFPFYQLPTLYIGSLYLAYKGFQIGNEIWTCVDMASKHNNDGDNSSDIWVSYRKNIYEKDPLASDIIFNITGIVVQRFKQENKSLDCVIELFNDISNVEIKDHEEYRKTIEYLIAKITNSAAKASAEHIQPKELTNLVNSLLESYNINSLYNPFAGLASYALSDCIEEYLGQEINETISIIANIRLDAYGKRKNILSFDLDNADSLFFSGKDIDELVKFSRIECMVATPPFGLKCTLPTNAPAYYRSIEERIINNFLESESLRTAILILPQRIGFDSTLEKVRQRLIDENILDLIIELPNKLFINTAIGTVVMVLSKNRNEDQDHVTMIDARKLIINNKLDNETISSIFEQYLSGELENIMPHLFSVSFEAIIQNEYAILPSVHLNKMLIYNGVPQGFEVRKLSEFFKSYIPQWINANQTLVIKGADLSKTPYAELQVNKLSKSNKPEDRVGLLDRDLLLVLAVGDKLKATYYKHNPEVPVAKNRDVLAFELIDSSISLEYVISEMWKPYIAEQYTAMKPSSYSYTSASAILTMNIFVPKSNGEFKQMMENSIVSARDEFNRTQIENLGIELSHLKDSRHDDYVKNIRMRKHAIAQILNELCPSIDMLIGCSKKKDGQMHESDIVSSRSGMTVGDYMDYFQKNLYKLSAMVDRLADDFKEDENASLEIIPFLKDYAENYVCGTMNFDIHINVDSEIDSIRNDAEINPLSVHISDINLSKVLKNIFVNASRHGFTDTARKDYCIKIDLSLCKMPNMEDGLCITIANNGNPLHADITADKIYTWGVSSDGTGIGGYEIKGLIEANGGVVGFESIPDDPSGFYVKYIIKLPISNE